MAPLPSFLVRLASAFAAQHITQRLVASPAFNRAVARMLHEVDHLPHRINGRQVPPYHPPVGSQFDVPHPDHGEPHDEPDPFAQKQGSQRSATSSPHSQDFGSSSGGFRPRSKLRTTHEDEDQSRTEARRSSPHVDADQTRGSSSSPRSGPAQDESPSDRLARELREIQDQLRGKS
ncbi:unnamed protein product [Tilletia controversa]|uniref:Uncharacterized protein n=3 Tax=Tilletia TaxID=13289 RepID=A0A8X7N007_9BASI|nr:hypothetical protein CF336_g8112 [Tilletia laevis]KAE8184403.1 hypothetical protein CF328_g7867 [Tilletia controversa]KAE8240639.1 hypothetical protein A4X03_0g8461 [Tilletia caries]KAE8185570.1 hypothetical protein CF335_g7684 [Tilletia laevis]KAE8253619.1 hypothetical protein A4X06_0g1314 [Tilletia controversa]